MPSCHTYGRLRPLPAAALILGLCLSLISGYAQAKSNRANIVLIVTDDEDVAAHAFMPKTKALLEDQGTAFANFFISYPWCCPSRASILRGQYGHNTHIVGNAPPWGGFETFRHLGLEESTVATWLHDAGYRTAMAGKYFNRYEPKRDGVPPGWDEWYVGGNAHASYNYVLNENGQTVQYGSGPEDYLSDVLTGKAVQVIRSSAGAGQPFFLYVLPFNPHSPSVAAPRHDGMFADAELPARPPSTRPTSATSRPSSAGCRRSIRSRSPTSSTSIESGSHRSRRSTTWWRASSRRLARPGNSTTPTLSTPPTTAFIWVSTG